MSPQHDIDQSTGMNVRVAHSRNSLDHIVQIAKLKQERAQEKLRSLATLPRIGKVKREENIKHPSSRPSYMCIKTQSAESVVFEDYLHNRSIAEVNKNIRSPRSHL